MTSEDMRKMVGVTFTSSTVGMFLIFFSVHLGTNFSNKWLAYVGQYDISYESIVITSFISMFLILGGALLLFGLFLAGMSYFHSIRQM
ncbi:hypothetical protein [Alkalihalobacillus sp. LMS39]|uniref:hypothetical protein n=1 Tax=Alkalihalobacillus sp. LMS39 TaxID=2924032 RepID=UPI001FB3C48C|nr:hypothetical protein [Alkalihalobacillus sp. LMS39]UOE96163.1 hypothetical protein MM271_11420 [Alkalihalobacillus sp. LMS39]